MNKLDNNNYLKSPKNYIITGIYNISKFQLDNNFFKRKNTFIDKDDFKNSLRWPKWYIKELLHNWVFIDYYAENKCNDIFAMWKWFVISNITDKPLYSTEYKDCTAIVWIWKDKKTWENISFLTHQWPDRLFREKENTKNEFTNKIDLIIKKLKNKCESWTIDITLLWWRNDDDFENYEKILNLTNQIVEQNLWFSLQVSAWPSLYNWITNTSKNIIVDTKNRRILLFKEYTEPSENTDFHIKETKKVLQNLLQIDDNEYIKKRTKAILNNETINNISISYIKKLIEDLDPEIFNYFDESKIKKEIIPILLKQIMSSKDKTLIFTNKWKKLKITLLSNNWLTKLKTELYN